MSNINFASDYFKRIFGDKVYRLSVAGGVTCPNRDGECGIGGCIFCAEGSGGFAPDVSDIDAELDTAKRLVEAKCRSGKFMAYFQSYTATYGDTDTLFARIERAMRREDIVAVAVATRPDCLPYSVILRLAELNNIKPVYVELGLQTASDKTAKIINRGYQTTAYIDVCRRLKSAGLNITAHMIIGLPNETRDDILNTARLIGETADGVKIQLMHVLRGTTLCDMYECGKYHPLALEEYTDLLCEVVEHLSPDTVIHRITGDGDKRLLVAPMWSADKKRTLNYINSEFTKRNIIQGKYFNG